MIGFSAGKSGSKYSLVVFLVRSRKGGSDGSGRFHFALKVASATVALARALS